MITMLMFLSGLLTLAANIKLAFDGQFVVT